MNVTGTEDAATIEYSTDGTDGSWTTTEYAATTEGTNTVYVRQTDIAGNVSTATMLTFELDTTAPDVSQIYGDQNGTLNVNTDSAGYAKLYDSESNLIGSAYNVATNTNFITPIAQNSVTAATLEVYDIAGNVSATTYKVALGTAGDDTIALAGQKAVYGFAGNNTYTASLATDLSNLHSLGGGSGTDTVEFTSAITDTVNFDHLFEYTNSVEQVQLFGASSINVQSAMSIKQVHTILTGNDNTGIDYQDVNALATYKVDATKLVDGKTLTLTQSGGGVGKFDVINLKGDVAASGLTGAVSVTAASGTGFGVNIATGSGNDTLTGSAGNDAINAGNGTNSITGDKGADTLTGGSGVDTFKFAAGDANAFTFENKFDSAISTGDTFTFTSGTDVITGFTQGVDKLSVTGANVDAVSYVNEGTTNFATALESGNLFLVHGNYNTTSHVFSVSSNGTSTLAIYNVGSGSEGIVLTGVSNLVAATDMVAAA